MPHCPNPEANKHKPKQQRQRFNQKKKYLFLSSSFFFSLIAKIVEDLTIEEYNMMAAVILNPLAPQDTNTIRAVPALGVGALKKPAGINTNTNTNISNNTAKPTTKLQVYNPHTSPSAVAVVADPSDPHLLLSTPIANRVRSKTPAFTVAPGASVLNVGLSTPPHKLRVFQDSVLNNAAAAAAAAALVNARAKLLQDKENVRPPNSPAPQRVTRSLHARREPLAVLSKMTVDEKADEEVETDVNEEGRYIYLDVSIHSLTQKHKDTFEDS